MCNIPILFIVFNRPKTTLQVFEAIRQAQPRHLFISADGPRLNHSDDHIACAEVRAIIDRIDWACEISTLLRERNLGCRQAVSSAIDWFFSQVEEGIVLEDDCLPSPTFFPYCEELLSRYRDDERVMQICGANFLGGAGQQKYSYYFSQYGPIWGWASWRRAWEFYDVNMNLWPNVKEDGVLHDVCMSTQEVDVRTDLYDRLWRGEIDTWDYQWGFTKMINSGLSIAPWVNLISNIGFGSGATHTTTDGGTFANLPVRDMIFPLIHPPYVCRDLDADRKFLADFMFAGKIGQGVRTPVSFWRSLLGRS